ncbi:MAG: hypothetical protein FWE30_03345 [Bacteroidales bacterium]|nr:hypothetical protein [Bacteroidales bacterium]MCL2738463.1 hypothetical protein [Bacteroidales bacterium]
MTPPASFLETLPLAALSPETASGYLALLVLEQSQEALLQELSTLYPQSDYKIALVAPTLSNHPAQIIESAKESSIPVIFVQSKEPSLDQLNIDDSFAASLISAGATPLAQQLIGHPQVKSFSWIGYQTCLSPQSLLLQLRERYFLSLRLGAYRENFKAAEPLIRPATHHFTDLGAVRHSDAPEAPDSGPNGLYAEEICQLARYMGVSSRPQACFIYGYPKKIQPLQIVTRLLAQVLWHLFESLATRQNEDPYQPKLSTLFSKKEVHMGEPYQVVHFLCSNHTKRWWFDILSKDGTRHFIPCTHEEYLTALKGELPLNWLHHYQKFSYFCG